MSGDPEQEYFTDGISEDIITDLSKVSALSVVARNTAFTFKGRSVKVPDVARQLGVSHVLEGSVRKAGNRVRITAQLIDGAAGDHIWAERYDRDLTDIFALQDEISEAIVTALKLKLLPEEKKAIERRGTDSVEAYDLFLRGRGWLFTFSALDVKRSIDLFRRATALDPTFAAAWASLANALGFSLMFFPETMATARPEMEHAFARATSLSPRLPAVLRSRAVQSALRYDWADLEEAFAALGEHTAAAVPAGGAPGAGLFFCALGHVQEGLRRSLLDRQADPLTLGVSFVLQMLLGCAGRFDEAEAEYERSKDLAGERGAIEWQAVTRMMALGDHERMKRLVVSFGPGAEQMQPFLPGLLKVIDEPDKALAIVRAAFDDPACQDSAPLAAIASWATYYGDDALALGALKRAFVDMRGQTLPDIWNPVFARLRRDPGFKEIVRGVGLADHWRKTGRWGDFARPVGENDFELS